MARSLPRRYRHRDRGFAPGLGNTWAIWSHEDHERRLYDEAKGPPNPKKLTRRRHGGEWDDPVTAAVDLRVDIDWAVGRLNEWNQTKAARRRHHEVTRTAEARRRYGTDPDLYVAPGPAQQARHGLWVITRIDEHRHLSYWANRPDMDWWTGYLKWAAVFATEDLAWLIAECYQDGTVNVERA